MMKSIFILSDAAPLLAELEASLSGTYQVTSVSTFEVFIQTLVERQFNLLLVDFNLLQFRDNRPDNLFFACHKIIRRVTAKEPILIFGEEKHRQYLAKTKEQGADQYFISPLDLQEVVQAIASIPEAVGEEKTPADAPLQQEQSSIQQHEWNKSTNWATETKSPVMGRLYHDAYSVAKTSSTVMLLGETGVGKGVIARLIHDNSLRKDGPFVQVHCGAIPENLIESELFGHEKGAFTGAIHKKLGRFEIAKGGTIFLDEIGTISASLQTKLLQVLQDKSMMRVGGENAVMTDVRVIAATNNNLLEMSQKGDFRLDLYYRLYVFPLLVPPLRERLEDLPALAQNFFDRLGASFQKRLESISPEVISILQKYPFPGNIRELDNILERSYIIETSTQLTAKSLPGDILDDKHQPLENSIDASLPMKAAREKIIEAFEKNYLIEALKNHKGKIQSTADAAGISDRQLRKLMHKYNLAKENFKN